MLKQTSLSTARAATIAGLSVGFRLVLLADLRRQRLASLAAVAGSLRPPQERSRALRPSYPLSKFRQTLRAVLARSNLACPWKCESLNRAKVLMNSPTRGSE